jgi:hypothetical protein
LHSRMTGAIFMISGLVPRTMPVAISLNLDKRVLKVGDVDRFSLTVMYNEALVTFAQRRLCGVHQPLDEVDDGCFSPKV